MSETRVRTIAERVIADARAAVTDLKITEDELHDAAEFLNRLGQAGEFPDLLDIFLAVSSVVANLGTPGGTTPNLAGPLYKAGAPTRESGLLYDGALPEGETPLTVSGFVLDVATGAPVTNAVLDVWQSDGSGIYDEKGYFLRGMVPVDGSGRYSYRTVVPEGYQIPAKGPTTEFLQAIGQHNWRPAHIHLRVHVGDTTPLQTQFFIRGAKYLDSDPVGAVYDDLILDPTPAPDGGYEIDFDIRIALDGPAVARQSIDGPRTKVKQ